MSDDPYRFQGDMEGYLKWAKKNASWNPQWCFRHWAPCPVEGKPGLVASVILAQHNISTMPPDVQQGDPTAMNSWQENQTTPACCRLGDEFIYSLWEEVSYDLVGEHNSIVDHPESRICKATFPPSFPYSPLGYCFGKLKGHEQCLK